MTERVRVLESFSTPSAQTNPYIIQLRDSLAATPGVEVVCWTWKDALLGRYDVFHTHWTEALIERRGRRSTVLRRILFALFLVRLRVTSTPVVRTQPPRDELAIKLALAVTVPGVDVGTVVQQQRSATMRALQDYTRLKAQALADVPANRDEVAWLLVVEQLIFQAEAEVRWLDHVETMLARRPRAPTTAAAAHEARRTTTGSTRHPPPVASIQPGGTPS